MVWPDDADGDVMRRLESAGFDFGCKTEIDFNIDFDAALPNISQLIGILEHRFPGAEIEAQDGYVLVSVKAIVSYQFALKMQADLTEISRPFGGKCESWGVAHPS